jgi:hypothetical protein
MSQVPKSYQAPHHYNSSLLGEFLFELELAIGYNFTY